MKNSKQNIRILISGGGTGGHVYPAISIADAIRELNPSSEILFVGAKGKIEMQKVPQAGYQIKALNILGFKRKLSFYNVKILWLLMLSLFKALKIIKKFKPNVVVGVGGYASGPIGFWANQMNIPLVLQEQNSYAGLTNKLLAKKAAKICVAYQNMNRFFSDEKIIITGNPIRSSSFTKVDKRAALAYFGLQPDKSTICIIGGSLGAASINGAVLAYIENHFNKIEYQIIWQCGKLYYNKIVEKLEGLNLKNTLVIKDFIDRMDYLFKIADVIVSRAGAGTISELCVIGKPVLLVPSPNVAEDHQTKNALALVQHNAAMMLKDSEIENDLFRVLSQLLIDKDKQNLLATNIKKLAKPDAALKIATIILETVK